MAKMRLLASSGAGRSTKYTITTLGRLFADVPAHEYNTIEPDKRYGQSRFNFETLPSIPQSIFSDTETATLENATSEYKKRITGLPPAIQKKELERLVIELSWKSSRIEGNTYTLLDTEKLILENKEATGHSKQEARMILNHKDAFTFIHENTKQFKTLTKTNLERLHTILVKGLSIGTGLRKKPVGVTGSKYKPLDNVHQITDAVLSLEKSVKKIKSPYAKALIALLGISYIQPFEDGNKRTSRLMANALLLAHKRAPLSYRSVDENEYREAMLVFYELNSVAPFKKIFVNQYDFAARNYAVK
jgi:Fic family protein